MNIPNSAKALIRAGFFFGIGLGLAYATFHAVIMVVMFITKLIVDLFMWLQNIYTSNSWAPAALAVLIFAAAAFSFIHFLPFFREKLLILGNKRR